MATERPNFKAIIEVFDSAFIQGVQYDHAKFIMDVQMNKKVYRYRNVTPVEFAMLITSKSTGKTFNAVIKGKKASTKLRRTQLS